MRTLNQIADILHESQGCECGHCDACGYRVDVVAAFRADMFALDVGFAHEGAPLHFRDDETLVVTHTNRVYWAIPPRVRSLLWRCPDFGTVLVHRLSDGAVGCTPRCASPPRQRYSCATRCAQQSLT